MKLEKWQCIHLEGENIPVITGGVLFTEVVESVLHIT